MTRRFGLGASPDSASSSAVCWRQSSPWNMASGWSSLCWWSRQAFAVRSARPRRARPPPERIPSMLVTNFDVIESYLPEGPDLDFMGERYREGGTLARLLWEHPYDLKLSRHLHRLTMPTLLVWGEDDRLFRCSWRSWAAVHSQGGHPDFQGRRPSRSRREARSSRRVVDKRKAEHAKDRDRRGLSERACPAMPRLSCRAAHRIFLHRRKHHRQRRLFAAGEYLRRARDLRSHLRAWPHPPALPRCLANQRQARRSI